MPRALEWDARVGRRLRLRDLHVFLTVVQHGSMAKGAARLGISTPRVSEIIAELEQALGVKLLDRSPHGVEPTRFGEALVQRSLNVFDELKEGIKDIGQLNDPTLGEVRLACPAHIAAILLPDIVARFTEIHPRATVQQDDIAFLDSQMTALRERRYDLTLSHLAKPLTKKDTDINVEVLFNNRMYVVASANSTWARRRRVDLAELVDEQWILTPPHTSGYARVTEAFAAFGLPVPKASIASLSTPLRLHLLMKSQYLAAIDHLSLKHLVRSGYPIKVLPIDFTHGDWPFVILTLKNRSLSASARRFIEYTRELARNQLAMGRRR
jgi:DNA-binding transcriptional LysR family regulator